MRKTVRTLLAICIAFSLLIPPASGQSELGTTMKKKCRLRSVACTACHDKEAEEKSRDRLTPFGEVIAKLVDGMEITDRLDAVEDAEWEVEDAIEDKIREEFVEVLEKLDEMKTPDGSKYADAIRDGDTEGIKPRK